MNKQITPVVMALVKNTEGKYLLTLRREVEAHMSQFHGIWQIPGGGQEFGEKPEETAVRELQEEAGLDIKLTGLIPEVFTTIRNDWHGLLLCYTAVRIDESQEVVINDEASNYGWFSIEEAKTLVSFPETIHIMELAEGL